MADQDLAELERRIGAALTRITTAAEGLAPAADAETLSALEAAQADAAKARAETDVLAEKIARLEEALETESLAVEQLRERNQTLKAAKEEAQTKVIELDAALKDLQSTRDEDRAELDEVLGALEPLVTEHPHA